MRIPERVVAVIVRRAPNGNEEMNQVGVAPVITGAANARLWRRKAS